MIRTPAISARCRSRRGGGVAIHPGTAAVKQDRSLGAAADGLVDGPADGRWQW
jgi:hypothetical protein